MIKLSQLAFLISFIILFSCSADTEMPVTDEEAMQLAETMSSSIKNKRAAGFDQLINAAVFSKRVKLQDNDNALYGKGFMQGVKNALNKNNFGNQIILAAGETGSYQLVKHYQKDNRQHLIFRLYTADYGLNYHDFELTKYKEKVCISDIFIYVTGENLSKSIADLLRQAVDLKSNSEKQLAEIEKLKEIKSLYNQKKLDQAKDLLNTLPSSLRKKKLVQVMYLQICAGLDESTYRQAAKRFESAFAKEPYMFLALMDGYIINQKYAEALECIDKIDSLINKDPFLDYYRALMYNLQQQPSDARVHLEKLVEHMPDFGDGVLELLVNYLEAGDTQKTKMLIQSYRNNKKFDQEKLNSILARYPSMQ
jgi:hypothetical protein